MLRIPIFIIERMGLYQNSLKKQSRIGRPTEMGTREKAIGRLPEVESSHTTTLRNPVSYLRSCRISHSRPFTAARTRLW